MRPQLRTYAPAQQANLRPVHDRVKRDYVPDHQKGARARLKDSQAKR
jgi:hypothetical protein